MATTSLEQYILLIDRGKAEITASLALTPFFEKMTLQPRGVIARMFLVPSMPHS